MLPLMLSFAFRFDADFGDLFYDFMAFGPENIVNGNAKYAFCRRSHGDWLCRDQLYRKLHSFYIECRDSYLPKKCFLIFDEHATAYKPHYSNFYAEPFNDVDTITPPEDEYQPIGRNPADSPVSLQRISVLVFSSDKFTRSRRGQILEQLAPLPGNRVLLDELICKNTGFDGYNVVWKCKSRDVPAGYYLAEATVSCEGWSGPGDSHIVPGSCRATYRVSRK